MLMMTLDHLKRLGDCKNNSERNGGSIDTEMCPFSMEKLEKNADRINKACVQRGDTIVVFEKLSISVDILDTPSWTLQLVLHCSTRTIQEQKCLI